MKSDYWGLFGVTDHHATAGLVGNKNAFLSDNCQTRNDDEAENNMDFSITVWSCFGSSPLS